MRKTLFSLICIVSLIILSSCSKDVKGSYTEYVGYSDINYNCYYEITSKTELDVFSQDFYKNFEAIEKYNEEYFENNSLAIFLISESSGGNRHQINTLGMENGVLKLEVVLTEAGMTCDIGYWIVYYELEKEVMNKLKSIEIFMESRADFTKSYTLKSYNNYQTTLPIDMPDDFYIYVWGNLDTLIEFDSRSNLLVYGRLKNGKNQTTLILGKEKLQEIYNLFREINFDKYPEMMNILHNNDSDNTHIQISLHGTNINVSPWIHNINNLDIDSWENHQELGRVVETFINDYIKNTSEFKSLEEKLNME